MLYKSFFSANLFSHSNHTFHFSASSKEYTHFIQGATNFRLNTQTQTGLIKTYEGKRYLNCSISHQRHIELESYLNQTRNNIREGIDKEVQKRKLLYLEEDSSASR